MEGERSKGRVCVTGGTGFLGSWLIFKLLENGYFVNTTVRPSSPDHQRDVSFLTNLPGASERLQIFNAELDKPESFDAAIEGCIGVFHVAHPMDLEGIESEEEKTKKAINGALGILQACLKVKTVKRVIYTSSTAAVMPNNNGLDIVDENTWTNTASLKGINSFGVVYAITKTLTEKACLEFAEKHGLDIVTVIPTWIHGTFISPNVPGSVQASMAMIFGQEDRFNASSVSFVHTDDVARAHIFLFEYPDARGRYICSALQITFDNLFAFLSARYPEYQIPSSVSSKEISRKKYPTFSSKKLSETGFKYRYGLEEMYDDAIRCCKEKGHL